MLLILFLLLPSILKHSFPLCSHYHPLNSFLLFDNTKRWGERVFPTQKDQPYPTSFHSSTTSLSSATFLSFATVLGQWISTDHRGVRGAFDEESCRMFLHEIGDDIVPRYPFAYGIQEIYEVLLGEYGRSQIADAISVFHELLEDESYEGNIWRSWRHAWRHRNVRTQLRSGKGSWH
jgi:hypothetical protein